MNVYCSAVDVFLKRITTQYRPICLHVQRGRLGHLRERLRVRLRKWMVYFIG